MQGKSKNSPYFLSKIGEIVKKLREKHTTSTANSFGESCDISSGTMSRLENGIYEPKISTLWKIAEGLNMPLSELIEIIEVELGENFTLIDD